MALKALRGKVMDRRGIRLLIAATVAAAGAAFAARDNPDLGALYQQAMVLERSKQDPAAAVPIYQVVAQHRADNPELGARALLALGRCYEQLGNTEKAVESYRILMADYGPEQKERGEAERRAAILTEQAEIRKTFRERGAISVDGVPPMAPMREETSTLVAAIRIALVPLGHRLPYSDLAAVSGAAFGVAFHPWTSPRTIVEDLAIADNALASVGRTGRWAPGLTDRTKDDVVGSLRSGIPVVAQGVVGPPEFGVIAAFDPEAETWYGRSPFDEAERRGVYRILERPGWRFLFIGAKTGPVLDQPDLLERSLLRAVYLMENEEQGTPHLHGFAALRWWAESLRNDTAFERAEAEGRTAEIVDVHEWMLDAYWSGRREAGRFLRRHLAAFAPREATRAAAAADAYITAAHTIQSRGFKPYGEGHPDAAIAEKSMRDRASRHQMAGILEQAMKYEREAVDHMRAVLDLRRGEILDSRRAAVVDRPQDVDAWRRLAEAQVVFGLLADAEESYGHLVAAASGTEKARAALQSAMCAFRRGEADAAPDALLAIPAMLDSKNDSLVRALDRRLAQWGADRAVFQRFFEALDDYIARTGIEPYPARLVIARRKWALGMTDAARGDYGTLAGAPLDWVSRAARRALDDIAAGRSPTDPLAG